MKTAAVIYGLCCCLLAFAICIYIACFLTDHFVSKSINRGPANVTAPATAIAMDLGLIAVFGLQHSGMARPAFKRFWTHVIPEPIERSTYVLASCLAFVLLFALWQTLPQAIYSFNESAVAIPMHGLAVLGLIVALISVMQLDSLSLLGLRQVLAYYRGQTLESPFQTPGLYGYVRHPLMLGFLLVFWGTPHLTLGRLLFNMGMTAYILLALVWEERDLVREFGKAYEDYQRRVPKILPWKGKPA
jgi:protein-S-isoprenylcysteine O-methyltransferase Ste14